MIWLTQQPMSELFQTSRTNVVEHIKHIYEEGESGKRELERQIDSGYYERYMLSQKPLTPAIEGSKRATGNVGDVCFNMVCLRDVRDVTADIRMWEKWESQE